MANSFEQDQRNYIARVVERANEEPDDEYDGCERDSSFRGNDEDDY